MEHHINIQGLSIITYSELYGLPSFSNSEIAELIKGFSLRKTLAIINKMSTIIDSFFRNEESGIREYIKIKQIYKTLNSYKLAHWGLYDNRLLICPQGLMQTYKWLLAYGYEIEEDFNFQFSYRDICSVVELVIIIADSLPKDEVKDHEAEFANAAQYFSTQRVVKYELARAYNIFVLSDSTLPKYIEEGFKNKYGISIEEYLANSFGFLNHVFVNDDFWNENCGNILEQFDAQGLQGSYDKYISMMGNEIMTMKKKILRSLHEPWNFSDFLLKPLLIVGNYAFPYNYHVFSYVWFEGLYWRARYCFPNDDTGFMDDFGKPFEKYIQTICKESLRSAPEYTFIDERQYTISKGNEPYSSDGYILKDNNLLIIECKAKAPVASTVSGYDLKGMDDEVIDLIVCPVHQVDKRYSEMIIYDPLFVSKSDKICNIYVIIVSLEKVQPTPYNYSLAHRYLRTKGHYISVNKKKKKCEEALITNEKIKAYFNFNTYEFEKLCALMENNVDIFEELNQYSMKPIGPFENFINERGYRDLRSQVVEDGIKKGLDAIFERTFGQKTNS